MVSSWPISFIFFVSNICCASNGSPLDLKWQVINFGIVIIFFLFKIKSRVSKIFSKRGEEFKKAVIEVETRNKKTTVNLNQIQKSIDSFVLEENRMMREMTGLLRKFENKQIQSVNKQKKYMQDEFLKKTTTKEQMLINKVYVTTMMKIIKKTKIKIQEDQTIQSKLGNDLLNC